MEDQPAVEVTGQLPGGSKVGVRLRDNVTAADVLLFLILVLLGVLIYMVNQEESNRDRRYTDMARAVSVAASKTDALTVMASKIAADQSNFAKEQETTNYILTLDQRRREQLNLAMPDTLRQRLSGVRQK